MIGLVVALHITLSSFPSDSIVSYRVQSSSGPKPTDNTNVQATHMHHDSMYVCTVHTYRCPKSICAVWWLVWGFSQKAPSAIQLQVSFILSRICSVLYFHIQHHMPHHVTYRFVLWSNWGPLSVTATRKKFMELSKGYA